MDVIWVLGFSIIFQFAAALLALKLIPLTGKRRAWMLISLALFVMGVRRCITLYQLLSGSMAEMAGVSSWSEWVAFSSSALFVAGTAGISPFFQSILRSKEACKESEAKFHTLSETVPSPILICQGYNFRYVNPAAETVSGYTQKELLEMDFWNLAHPDFRELVKERELARQRGEQVPSHYEAKILTREGEERWLDLAVVQIDLEGAPAVLASAIDTTRRKQAEEMLSWEARVNASVADISKGIISSVDLETISHLVLDHAERLTASSCGYAGHIDPQTGFLVCPKEAMDMITGSGIPDMGLIGSTHIQDAGQGREKSIVFQSLDGLGGWVLENRKSLMTNAAAEDPRSLKSPECPVLIQRFLSAPVMIDGILAGQVTVANSDRDYGERDVQLIERLASLYALAIQQKRAFEELSRHRHHLEDLIKDRTRELMEAVESLQREVSERRKAEEALGKISHLNKLILESMVEGICGLDSEGKVTFVNPAAAHMVGWKIPDLVGRLMHTIIHHTRPNGSPYPREECAICKAYKTGAIQHVDSEVFWRKDGSSFPVEYISTPMHDEEDNLVGTVVAFKDITERKQAQAVLQKEQERLAIVLDGNPIPAFVIDREHKVVFWNRACETLTGVPKEKALGRPADSEAFYPGQVRATLADVVLEMDEDLMRMLYGNKSLARCSFHSEAFEASDRLKVAGTEKYIYFLAARLRDSSGEVIGAIETFQDISEQEQLHRQLRQAQKMQAIGTLAGGIAHDFNNILMAIIGYADMAMEEVQEGSTAWQHLDQVFKAGQRAKDLVKQILAFSRQSEQERQPVQIVLIIKETLKFLRASLPTTIVIRQKVSSGSGLVMADPTQMHQVLMNLCSNAAHAMREKGGALEVSLMDVDITAEDTTARSDLKAGAYVKLTVSDTGHGMDREIMERIFDPYFSTKGPGEGTGMGLAMVHGIIKSYGGSIIAHSERGKGSTFQIFIPRIDSEVGNDGIEDAEPLPRGTERILFVDDEEMLVNMAELMLDRLGYEVTATTSSLEALDVFRTRPEAFDLVITDQTMPIMTGAKLAEKMLQIRPDILIILCTGYSESINPERAKAIGIREFIPKPLVRREIARTIRRVLDEGTSGKGKEGGKTRESTPA